MSTVAIGAESATALARPWRRFWARVLDYWLLIFPVGFLTGMVMGSISVELLLWLQKPMSNLIVNWCLSPLVMPLEGLIYGWLGTTPGKWLLGVQLLTVNGQHPTRGQYLRRQIDVYIFGLGAWLPLVSLLTTLYQYGKVRDGQAAGYDQGKFEVRATRLSLVRLVCTVLILVGMMAVNGYFKQEARESHRSYTSGGPWTNKLTGREITIPSGWSHQQSKNQDKQDVDMFFHPDAGIYAVFAREAIPGQFELEDYASAWIRATSGSMSLYVSSEGDTIEGQPALVVLGSVARDKSQKVHATLLKRNGAVWRVVLIGTAGVAPDRAEALKLRQALFSSVP